MADYAQIRRELALACERLSDVKVAYDLPPDSNIVVPAVIVMPDQTQTADYNLAAGRANGTALFRFGIVGLVQRFDTNAGYQIVDRWLSGLGSVKHAVELDPTLNGHAKATVVTDASDYGDIVVGDVTYSGIRFSVEVHA